MTREDEPPSRHFGDFTRWGTEMEELDGDARLRTTSAYAALDARARDLVERLERAIGDRFEVKYHPWVVVDDEE